MRMSRNMPTSGGLNRLRPLAFLSLLLTPFALASALVLALGAAAARGAEELPPVEKLARDLADADVNVRRDAAYELAKRGPAAKEALPALITALEDRDPQVWLEAAKALAAIEATSRASARANNDKAEGA